jgi:hypothetical protein
MNKQSFMRALVLSASTVGAGAAHAADVDGVFKAGLDFGGDTLVTAFFVDGSTDTIKANEGIVLGGGVAIFNDAKTASLEATISWKYASISADNGEIEFTRFPVDALLFYNFPKARLGAGVTYHLNPDLKGSGVIGGLNVEFDNALGFIAQADYRASEKVAFGLRYTKLSYDVAGATESMDANGVGVTFTATF